MAGEGVTGASSPRKDHDAALPTGLNYGRFPKFHRLFSGRDPVTLKSDIVSKKHPQLICSELRLSN